MDLQGRPGERGSHRIDGDADGLGTRGSGAHDTLQVGWRQRRPHHLVRHCHVHPHRRQLGPTRRIGHHGSLREPLGTAGLRARVPPTPWRLVHPEGEHQAALRQSGRLRTCRQHPASDSGGDRSQGRKGHLHRRCGRWFARQRRGGAEQCHARRQRRGRLARRQRFRALLPQCRDRAAQDHAQGRVLQGQGFEPRLRTRRSAHAQVLHRHARRVDHTRRTSVVPVRGRSGLRLRRERRIQGLKELVARRHDR